MASNNRKWRAVAEMDIDEAHRYIYHLQHKLTETNKKLQAKEAIVEHMRATDSKQQARRVVDELERLMRERWQWFR